jgi:hypothetical protein
MGPIEPMCSQHYPGMVMFGQRRDRAHHPLSTAYKAEFIYTVQKGETVETGSIISRSSILKDTSISVIHPID